MLKEPGPATPPFELELHDTATDGRAVGRLANGKVVFVEGALGGEVVTAALIHETSSMADAQVVSVLKKSDMRQKPPCRQASTCGGCQLQHVTPSSQLALKKQWLVQTLRRIGQWPAEQITAASRILRCEQGLTSRYRQRVRWHFDGEHLGFFARRSHQVVSAEGCIIAAAPLEQARAQLLARLRSSELSEAFSAAGIIDMQIEATLLKNETVSLWLKDVRCSQGNVAEAKIRELMHNFIRSWNGPQIDERGFVQVHHPEIESFSLAPQGFIQPHRHALELYRTEISKQLKSLLKHPLLEPLLAKGNWTAWDLYCGAGAFSDLPSKAAGNNRAVTTWCIEGIAAAVSATKKNHPGLTGQAIADDVREFIAARIRANDLPEIVVCDPPRDGIGAPTTRALATALSKKASPSVVVWIACDMASFARDTKPFLDSTFELFSLSLFDCFTHTTHAEIIGIFWHAGQMQKQGHHH